MYRNNTVGLPDLNDRLTDGLAARQRWLSVLTKAHLSELESVATELALPADWEWLRRPEPGAVMVRGRMGGSGAAFNMGEMTVTRAAVRLADGTVGMGYAAGRSHRKAELVALFDAVLQQTPALVSTVIDPLAQAQTDARLDASRKAASTKVDFFTMVRGQNQK